MRVFNQSACEEQITLLSWQIEELHKQEVSLRRRRALLKQSIRNRIWYMEHREEERFKYRMIMRNRRKYKGFGRKYDGAYEKVLYAGRRYDSYEL